MNSTCLGGGIVALALAASVSACNQATNTPAGAGASLAAKTDGPAVPYKLGTFEREGKAFMGLVLHDTQVVDIAQANAAFENGNGSAGKLVPPADMKELISKYDSGWKDRLPAARKGNIRSRPGKIVHQQRVFQSYSSSMEE